MMMIMTLPQSLLFFWLQTDCHQTRHQLNIRTKFRRVCSILTQSNECGQTSLKVLLFITLLYRHRHLICRILLLVRSYFRWSKTILGSPEVLDMFCFCLVAQCWVNIVIASTEANYMASIRGRQSHFPVITSEKEIYKSFMYRRKALFPVSFL